MMDGARANVPGGSSMNAMSRRNVARIARAAVLGLVCVLLAGTLRATEIKVVTSGAFTAAYLELVPEYERTTHDKLATEFGPSMGTTHNAIPVRLQRGEVIDVVIMAAPALARSRPWSSRQGTTPPARLANVPIRHAANTIPPAPPAKPFFQDSERKKRRHCRSLPRGENC